MAEVCLKEVALRKEEEGRIKSMIIDAIIGIQAGQNPRVIDSILRNYLPLSQRADGNDE